MRLVVFGWGNDARGDDGLGPLLLTRVAHALGQMPLEVDLVDAVGALVSRARKG